MNFRTEISPDPSPFKIDYNSPVMFLGSCFSDNIGNKLKDLLFPVNINPFGVVYNPLSVNRSLKIILENKHFREEDLFSFNSLWHSWDHHSKFSGNDKIMVLESINREIEKAHFFLKEARFLILTLGTAWVFRLKESGKVVCNCHKVPANKFDHELLGVSEIVDSFIRLRQQLKDFNPELKIVFTVSPVRHWKDGAHGNQVSKSVLHLAVHNLLQMSKCGCQYFPAYELTLDDLRDYRYFADDLLHPNNQAIEYIWEKFSHVFLEEPSLGLSREIQKIHQASGHKLFNPSSESSREFLKSNLKKLEEIKRRHPHLEIEALRERIVRVLNA